MAPELDEHIMSPPGERKAGWWGGSRRRGGLPPEISVWGGESRQGQSGYRSLSGGLQNQSGGREGDRGRGGGDGPIKEGETNV